jgi:hypothetical protein
MQERGPRPRVTKFGNFFYKIPCPSGGSFAKSNLFLIHFLWALLVRKMMDGREREGRRRRDEWKIA